MTRMNRREALGALAAGTGGVLFAGRAEATLLRGLSLPALAQSSDHIVLATALESNAHWEVLGGRRRIVTDTRVRIDDVLGQSTPEDPELLVRTLGGSIGEVAALVFGEAMLSSDEPCVLFLVNQGAGVRRVNGMAQGHYPLAADARNVMRLLSSPRTPELVGNNKPFAVERLVGQPLSGARVLVREALRQ